MYVFQRNYNEYEDLRSIDRSTKQIVIIYPPEDPPMVRDKFYEVIKNCIESYNSRTGEESYSHNKIVITTESSPKECYLAIYRANAVIAECSDKNPNVFYMIGLAHAVGRPVCSCYDMSKIGNSLNIPFDVHGRQSMTYSVSTMEDQGKFMDNLKKWIESL